MESNENEVLFDDKRIVKLLEMLANVYIFGRSMGDDRLSFVLLILL